MISNKIIQKEFLMELVYLWVEKYKNIENQGFNFSPRFRCEYDEDTNELSIINVKQDIKSIYGSNVLITGIIGENGAGKSSLGGEFISKKLFGPITTKGCILLIENNNKLFLLNDTKMKIILKSETEIVIGFSEDFSEIINTLFNNKSISEESYNHNNLLKSEFAFLSKKGNYGNNIYSALNGLGFRKTRPDLYNIGRYVFSIISEFSSRDNQFSANSYRVIRPLERKDINQYDTIIGKLDGLQEIINLLDFPFTVIKTKTKIEFLTKDKTKLLFGNLSFGQKFAIHMLASIYHRIKHNKISIFFLDEVTLSMNPRLERKFIHILLSIVKKVEEELQESISVHFIITSHSPFVLSDIPKENVIFLKKDENTARCVNDTNNVHFETFGANIHSLLANGFFMKDGLMGEFAKEKINQVYNFIVQKDTNFIKTKEEAQNIINLIGEPMLRKELQFLYDEKFEVDEIDKQIREYEEAIEELKSKKKKND
jgi:ABC-type dipeptide/oligopeptide/nickel transport system ATPase component